jgi:phage gpG-like protein
MTAVTITVEDEHVLTAIRRIRQRVGNLGPLLKSVGEDLAESTKQRFATSTAPDGSRWEPNTQLTLMQYLHAKSGIYSYFTDVSSREVRKIRTGDKKGYFRKDGKLAKKGIDTILGKRPLIGETGALAHQIHFRVKGNVLEVGSSMEYAAMQQFGGKKSEFPNLWGDIPARPFLGISDNDIQNINQTIVDYLGL